MRRHEVWNARLAVVLFFSAACHAHPLAPQALTPVPKGPIHADGNRLVDSQGRTFLIRGTDLPEFRTLPADPEAKPAAGFGPHSATVLSTIRLRSNMNAVRIPLSLSDYAADPQYLHLVRDVVRKANDVDLVVILAVHDPEAPVPSSRSLSQFWRDCSTLFRDTPRLIFELAPGHGDARTTNLIRAVRGAGATQPVLIDTDNIGGDGNAVYQISPRYAITRTDRDRDLLFAELAARAPVLASGLDPELGRDSEECAAFPDDPSEAEALVRANLEYFDAHAISWMISEYRPGKLIDDYRYLLATSLGDGWTCGQPGVFRTGIGQAVQFHLWGLEPRGLVAVGVAGDFVIARGSIAIIYGGIFAERDASTKPAFPAAELGNVSIRVTDSLGMSRRAGLLYVSAGWGQANFVVPAGCAPGPARVTVERGDGTHASAPISIADVAPGFWTATGDGHGPVIGLISRAVPGQTPKDMPIYRCLQGRCSAVPIPGSDEVRLFGSGFRYTHDLADIQVRIGGASVPVLAFGPAGDAGVDSLTVRIPANLRGRGETDLMCSIRGQKSNVVRINLGPAKPPQLGPGKPPR
jgi:uncharacterized protein (TIGR03437 family)